jgi:hypothetical protein
MFNLLVGVTGGGSCQKEVRCWHMRAAGICARGCRATL